jgi:hypothetical protein
MDRVQLDVATLSTDEIVLGPDGMISPEIGGSLFRGVMIGMVISLPIWLALFCWLFR